jgi:uncharacterized protein (TIGR03643 family)
MAWQDDISFETIRKATGLNEKQVSKIMRTNLKSSSYKLWKERSAKKSL